MSSNTADISGKARGRKILLAEDNPQDVFLLTEAFLTENIPVQIDCVEDGDQLLTLLTGDGCGSYGLAVLDAHLPKRSAEEVLTLLGRQQKRPSMPLIILTTLASNQEKDRLMELGVKEILAKPFDLNEYFALAKKLGALLIA
ncbi:MAG TPA: response regulator [Bryobacteraceae bacterium]